MVITEEKLREAQTKKGGFSKSQIRMAQDLAGVKKGWRKKLLGRDISEVVFEEFKKAGRDTKSAQKQLDAIERKRKMNKPQVINAGSPKQDLNGFWKPQEGDVPQPRVAAKPEPQPKKKRKKDKKRRQKKRRLQQKPDGDFYMSREWRSLRYRVLRKYGARCQCCGRTAADGIKIHVDHIEPRSKFPDKALVFENLQILCEPCNMGKTNKFFDDWRPDSQPSNAEFGS